MIITVVLYATSSHVTTYQVTTGPLTKNPVCTALALRSEEVITAENSGYIEYYATEGMQVRKDGSVYSISNEQQENTAVTLSDEQMEEVRSSAEQFSYAYNSNNFYDTYSYKYQVRERYFRPQRRKLPKLHRHPKTARLLLQRKGKTRIL